MKTHYRVSYAGMSGPILAFGGTIVNSTLHWLHQGWAVG